MGDPNPPIDVRLPVEADRERFLELFCDEAFMVFSGGTLTGPEAQARFDRMLANAVDIPFAKQPVIERSTGEIVGYAGVDWFDLDGDRWLEFGYRLVPHARGKGYGTEASRVVLAKATGSFAGELLAIIDPMNERSQRVAAKLGFLFWKQGMVDGGVANLYRLRID